jgi:diaminopimelate epimerase
VDEGKHIRYSKEYEEQGINVNFVEIEDRRIYVRTYERGVENETYSCGTGVTACALVCAHNELGFNRVEVQTLGGNLAVEFKKHENNTFDDIWLCGPATFVFKGEITLN